MIRWFPELSVGRPVTVVTAFLVVIVVGVLAWVRIPVQMMPSGWSPPYLWIGVPYEDSTPLETEARVVKPLEEQLSTVAGIKHIESSARSDWADVGLEFNGSVDMDEAYNGVADRVERARAQLPDDLDEVWIWRFDPSDEPVVWAGLSVPDGTEDPWWLVNRVVQKRLERIPGVGKVDVWGVDEPIVWVEFNRESLLAHGVDLTALLTRLGQDNFQLASGQVTDRGEVRYVRSLARFEQIEELRRYPVAPGVALEDVAAVEYKAIPSADINRIDGKEGAALAINKESSANTVDVAREIRLAFAELEADPRLEGFTFPVFFDQGKLIEDSMGALQESALEGGLLAVFVLVLFLREWRITALIAATIPATLLLTLTVMYFRGDSLNLLSMLGLMLAVGMVVDNSVVVVEAIYRRRQAGQDAVSAAIDGTAEMMLPITGSTLTAVVTFLPIVLMSEDADFSFFMSALGLPVVFIQLGSLFITLLFTPLSTVWLGNTRVVEDARWIRWLADRVDRGVRWVLDHPVDAWIGVVAMGLLTIMLPMRAVGCSGESDGNLNDFTVRFELPRSFTYAERLEVVQAFERLVDDNHEAWGVRVHRTRLTSSSNSGRLYVYLDEDAEGAMPREEVIEDAEKKLPDLPGVTSSVGWGENNSNDSNLIGVRLRGEDTETLARLAQEARRRIRAVEGVLSVTTDVETEGGDEIRLGVRRDVAERTGVGAAMVGRLVSFAMRGTPLPSFQMGEKEVRVYTRFTQADRDSVDRLLAFEVGSRGGAIPLANLVDAQVGRGWGSIQRADRATALGMTVELARGLTKEDAYLSVEQALDGMDWPRGYGVDRGNDWQEQLESDRARNNALLLSLVAVFVIMAVLFESVVHPLTVMFTVPMAGLGVYWGLWATGTPFDSMAGVGVIILIGIVVNNGIVLVDVVNELRDQGVSRAEALRQAVGKRLRPVLMTALCAIMGVVPMSVGDATFIGIPYAPLGRVILSGMLVSTVLTLFFIPLCYAMVDDVWGVLVRTFWYLWPRPRKET